MPGTATTVAAAVAPLRAIYDELAGCPDLRAGPVVDAAFRRLVRLVVDTPHEQAAAVLAHPAVRDVVDDLRSLCFLGEFQLEAAWAQRIAESDDPVAELERFPFAANYRRLHAMEREAVARLAEVRRGDARPAPPSSGRDRCPLDRVPAARRGRRGRQPRPRRRRSGRCPGGSPARWA